MIETNSTFVIFLKEKSVLVKDDESILDASLKAGIPHYHVCGGNAECSTCRILVIEGAENLSDPTKKESKLKSKLGLHEDIRLACQTRVLREPVTINRIVRDISDVETILDERPNEGNQQIGEERELALFFMDIRNFTPFIESNLPFDVIHIISKLFHIIKLTLKEYDGRIIETAGDGIYAVFGLDNPENNFIKSSVNASFAIQKAVEGFNQNYLLPYFNHEFEIGIGLHAGKVIFGSFNRDAPEQLAVMGFAVNVAARLQNATKEFNNSFIASETIVKELDSSYCEHCKLDVNLKGVSQPVSIFLLGSPFKN
jgi:adenylate cyclase